MWVLQLPYVGDSIKRIDTLVDKTAKVQSSLESVDSKLSKAAADQKQASNDASASLDKKVKDLVRKRSTATTRAGPRVQFR